MADSKGYGHMFCDYPELLEPEQLGHMLGVCTATAYKLLRANEIKHLRIGSKYKIPKAKVMEYLGLSADEEVK